MWVKIAQCQRQLGELQDAAESYQAGEYRKDVTIPLNIPDSVLRRFTVVQNLPDDLDSRLALAEIYEALDMREEALQLVNEG